MTDIANQDLSVCNCRIWICLDITRFCEQSQLSSGTAAYPKNDKLGPIARGGRFRQICTAICNRRDSSSTCKMCRLEPYLNNLCRLDLIMAPSYGNLIHDSVHLYQVTTNHLVSMVVRFRLFSIISYGNLLSSGMHFVNRR